MHSFHFASCSLYSPCGAQVTWCYDSDLIILYIVPETMDIIDQKKEARLKGNRDEWKRLKGVYKAR